MERYKLGSYKSECTISVNDLNLRQWLEGEGIRKFVDRVVPSGRLEKITLERVGENEPEIIVDSSSKESIVERFPKFFVGGIPLSAQDVIPLADYFLERKRQEVGVYNIHASAVGRGESAVVIHGASKAGKTVLSFACAFQQGLDYLVNERALIELGSSTLVGGCRDVRIDDYHRRLLPELGDKSSVVLDRLDRRPIVRAIVYPSIDSGSPDITLKEIGLREASWLLYPEFSAKIRGVNKRTLDLTYPLDPIDTKPLAMQRIRDLDIFNKNVPFLFVKGSIQEISKYIASLLK